MGSDPHLTATASIVPDLLKQLQQLSSSATLQPNVPTQMDLDFVRPRHQGNQTFQVNNPVRHTPTTRFNAFSGSPLQQPFWHYAPPIDDVFNAVQSSLLDPPPASEKHREEQQQSRRPSSSDRRPQRTFSNSSRGSQGSSGNREYQSSLPFRGQRSQRA